MRLVIVLIAFIFSIVACKKNVVETISNNNALSDTTISQITVDNFVNKSFIVLLGRKPSDVELTNNSNTLYKESLSNKSTTDFIQFLFSALEYKQNVYALAKIKYLNNLNTSEIQYFIDQFDYLLQDTTQKGNWPLLQIERDKLYNLQIVPTQIIAGSINAQEVFKRCCLNMFYDDINMGSQNFVVSVYDHFFQRYPTLQELSNGIEMAENKYSTILGKPGKNTVDFVNIVMENNGFYEGQVRELFQRYLFRQPSINELSLYTQYFFNNKDYKLLQLKILTTNEYTGK